MKKIYLLAILALSSFALIGCDARDNYAPSYDYPYEGSEEYLEIQENQFLTTLEKPTSSFSLDTSTAGYANLRRMINRGTTIPKDSVKIEEMVNYFSYDYPSPTNGDALGITPEIMECPWNTNNLIVSIGVKAKEVDTSNIRNNIVFLLDVSGSMQAQNKLPLMQAAFKLFVESLNDDDTVSIVTYAGSDSVLLTGAKGFEKKKIISIIEDLEASGSTAGSKGIQTAYELAKQLYIEGGNNRIILGTDGDFNVGISSINELESFISEKRNQGIYLSVLGFGTGNLKDNKLETLANNGDGNYAYIDTIAEARKFLVQEIGGTVVSKDTKTQVTFNPRYVKEYRLLGYENKLLTDDEFENDNTDAGEILSGYSVTAVYELVLNNDETVASTLETNWLDVEIRHKDPLTEESKVINKLINESHKRTTPSEDILFISGVIEVGLILRDSPYKANSSYSGVITRIQNLNAIEDEYKKEFLDLVKKLND